MSVVEAWLWDGTKGAESPCVVVNTSDPFDATLWRHTVTGRNGSGNPVFDPAASVSVRDLGDAMGSPAGQWWDFEVQQGGVYGYSTNRNTLDARYIVAVPDSVTWLVPIEYPELSARVVVEQSGWGKFTQAATQAVVKVPGNPYRFVADFGRDSPDVALSLILVGEEDREQWQASLAQPGTRFLSVPTRHYPAVLVSPYVVIGDVEWEPLTPDREVWRLSVQLSPVERPTGSVRERLAGFPGLTPAFADLADNFGGL